MASLIKYCFGRKQKPQIGDLKVRRKLVWYPRILASPKQKGKLELRWLGVEKILYQFQTWKGIPIGLDPKECPECDFVGWRSVEWYW